VLGVTSNEKGFFKLNDVAIGAYVVRFSFIGYAPLQRSINISGNQAVADLGTVSLNPSENKLKDVNITAEKDVYSKELDKKVINVDKNITTAGGTASDVLQTVPGISQDGDGNLQLRGTGNFTVLVDGKPSGNRGANINQLLEQIPASSIENIEVITNPSAKYDASGTGGIINIVLKKNKKQGLSGNASVNVGTRDKYTANFSLNYKGKKASFYSNFSGQSNANYYYGEFRSRNFTADTAFRQYYITGGNGRNMNFLPKLGLDLYVNDHNTITINTNFTYNHNVDRSRIIRQFSNDEGVAESGGERRIYNVFTGLYGDATFGLKHLFKGERHYIFADFTYSRNHESNDLNAHEAFIPSALANLSYISKDSIRTVNSSHTFLAQVDYTRQLDKRTYIEAGYLGELNMLDRDLNYMTHKNEEGNFASDTNKSNHFKYREQIEAIYGTYNGTLNKLSYKFGLRFEQTWMNGELTTTGQTFKQSYFSAFPSVNLANDLGHEQTLRFNYSRRISRPSINQLNPFGDYTDPRNIRMGNPAVKPEFTHSFELAYDKGMKKLSFSGTVYYRLQSNMITYVRHVQDNGFAVITFENLGTTHNYGLELSYRYTPAKWWNINLDLNGGGQTFDDPKFSDLLYKQSWTYGGNFMSNWTIMKFWNIQATYFYRSKSRLPQGEMKAMHGADLAMRFFMLKGKLSINLRASDLFNTRQFSINSSGANFEFSFYRKRDSRNFFIGISYRFGKQENKQDKRKRETPDAPGGGMEMF